MSILFSNEIISAIVDELRNASVSVQIITAYCKVKTLKYLNSYIREDIKDKKLLVRFRLDDLIKGSTDFEILDICRSEGWEVYIRFDLHAKTYIVDDKRGLVGSANLTNSGLNLSRKGNAEIATLVDIEEQDLIKINNLYKGALLVDDAIYKKMKDQLIEARSNNSQNSEGVGWDTDIMDLFNPQIETLFSYELPDDYSLQDGEYFSFLDFEYAGDIGDLKNTFRWSNAYNWLLTQLKAGNGCMYFGELSQSLHNSLVTDPKPYRKDVKKMLRNLLDLIEDLDMDEIIIDRPNYSQRVQLKG